MKKSLYDISWQVSESEYRDDSALSYSIIAKYAREGFNNLSTLFDRVESPSLLFGSVVDCLMTDRDSFDSLYSVCDFPDIKDSDKKVVDLLWSDESNRSKSFMEIPQKTVIEATESCKYQLNWKPETRVKVLAERCSSYWECLKNSEGRTVINKELYEDAVACVNALMESSYTRDFFTDNPFEDIEVLFQLKFKGDYDGIPLRIMVDALKIDHKNKIIYPIDLKTSHNTEWDFPKSFIQWFYMYQAGIYWHVLRQNLDKDSYFKDFKLEDYRFIVVNRDTKTPLVWKFNQTQSVNEYKLGSLEIDNWRVKLKELYHYLQFPSKVPENIKENSDNIIEEYFKDDRECS